MRPKRNDLSADLVRSVLDYDPETGIFTWRTKIATKGRYLPGQVAGSRKKFHVMIGLLGHRYCAHRLAWLWMTGEWPAAEVDHVNLDGFDNRWTNLRAATRSQNNANTKNRSNISPFKRVRFDRRRGTWQARIKYDGREKHLGYFATAEEASEAYRKAAQEHWGEFHRS